MVASAVPDDRMLVTTHTFDATPARVFAAWTDPGQFVEWFGPPGMKNTHCRFDLRVGGTWEFQLGQSRYLVGDDATAADLFLAPIVFTFPVIPGLKEIGEAAPHLGRWARNMAVRPSMKATEPEPIAAVAA